MTIHPLVLVKTWVFGRGADCDVQVDDQYVAKQHCRVALYSDGSATIEDLGTMNGTFLRAGDKPRDGRPGLDEVRIYGPTTIVPGLVIRIGKTEISWSSPT